MGTRHLIAVQLDGQYRIAQYGQWDGYPSGQGDTVIEFLKNWDRPVFEMKLRESSFMTPAEMEALDAKIKIEKIDWTERFPALTRDTGAKILQIVQDSAPGIKLKNGIDFAGDSLFCEFAYIIDLDKNALEVFVGFNHKPLEPGDRFYDTPLDPEATKNKDGSQKYFQIRLAKSFPLSDLPTITQMEDACDAAKVACGDNE